MERFGYHLAPRTLFNNVLSLILRITKKKKKKKITAMNMLQTTEGGIVLWLKKRKRTK